MSKYYSIYEEIDDTLHPDSNQIWGLLGEKLKPKHHVWALLFSDMIAAENYDVDISVDKNVQGYN